MADVSPLPRPTQTRALKALTFWYEVTRRCLAGVEEDLSARQTGILLAVYLETGPHSIKSLSESLGISKPAVCRAIDALEKAKFVKRQRDKDDKRNVILQRTVKGSVYLSEFAEIILAVSKAAA